MSDGPRSSSATALYHRCLTALQRGSRRTLRAWNRLESWETQLSPTTHRRKRSRRPHRRTRTTALIECYYACHNCFLPKGGVPLDTVAKGVKRGTFPLYVLHGKDDVICDVADARTLCSRVPRCQLTVVPDAGHALSEPATLAILRRTLQTCYHQHKITSRTS